MQNLLLYGKWSKLHIRLPKTFVIKFLRNLVTKVVFSICVQKTMASDPQGTQNQNSFFDSNHMSLTTVPDNATKLPSYTILKTYVQCPNEGLSNEPVENIQDENFNPNKVIIIDSQLLANSECSQRVVYPNEIDSKKAELCELLKKWELEKLIDHFMTESITVETLKIIKRHHIEKLLRNFDMGTQILFEDQLEKWRDAINSPLYLEMPQNFLNSIMPSSPSTGAASPCTSRMSNRETNDTKFITLANVLNDSPKGPMICDIFNKNEKFTEDQRTLLVNTIAQYYDDKNIHLSLSMSYQLEQEILSRFPSEKLEFYRTSKRGKIYNRYNNIKTSIKNITKMIDKKNDGEKDSPEKLLVPEADAEICIRSLKYDNLSSAEFDHCWRACGKYRVNEIKAAKTTFEIMEKWPQYKCPSGYRLIEMDYNIMFNSSYSLLDTWQNEFEGILKFVSTEHNIKEKNIKVVIEALKKSEISENGRNAGLLWAIHGYLVPTQRIVKKDISGKKSTVKFTIKDSQESFVYVGKSIQEIEDHLQFLSKNNESIQPFIVAVGKDITSIQEIFVYFDGIKFRFNNFIRALDICFKTTHLFNLKYPLACEIFWTFIETYFYNLNQNKCKKFSKVHIFTQELKNCKNDENH